MADEKRKYTKAQLTGQDIHAVIALGVELGLSQSRLNLAGDSEIRRLVIAACEKAERLLPDDAPSVTVEDGDVPEPIRVVDGIHDDIELPFQPGRTLDTVMNDLATPWNFDRDTVRVYVNGAEALRKAWAQTTLAAGAEVEIHEPSGEKGGE